MSTRSSDSDPNPPSDATLGRVAKEVAWQEREKLVDAMWQAHTQEHGHLTAMRAALAVAEAAFAQREAAIRADEREQCAQDAHEAWLDGVPVAEIPAAIRARGRP